MQQASTLPPSKPKEFSGLLVSVMACAGDFVVGSAKGAASCASRALKTNSTAWRRRSASACTKPGTASLSPRTAQARAVVDNNRDPLVSGVARTSQADGAVRTFSRARSATAGAAAARRAESPGFFGASCLPQASAKRARRRLI